MKKILITGVSSGIGYHAVSFLIDKGYYVYGSVRSAKDATRMKESFPKHFKPLIFDVCNPSEIMDSCDLLSTELNGEGLHALINNAGIAVPGPLFYLTEEELEMQMDVNVKGVFRVTNAFLPLLGFQANTSFPPGKIINISSVSGLFNLPFNGAYCISKHALESMSDIYRRELMNFGIDLILIEPGPIKTAIWNKAVANKLAEKYKDSLYGQALSKADKMIKHSENSALEVDRVSKLIYQILQRKKNKARYLLHHSPVKLRIFTKLFPARVIDRILRKNLMGGDKLRPF